MFGLLLVFSLVSVAELNASFQLTDAVRCQYTEAALNKIRRLQQKQANSVEWRD